ncbi:unnamed protein product [Penicillium olsonii]|nr:unnamed protein product [Penicillium olsonii]
MMPPSFPNIGTRLNLHSKAEFYEQIFGVESPAILDCYAEWCGPCRAIAPKVQEFSDLYTDVKFFKFDVEKDPDLAAELGVRAMPTFMFFKDGQKYTEVVGANTPSIEDKIKALIA